MTYHQHTNDKKRIGNEFSAIYGITLVVAFMLMTVFQYLSKGEGTEQLILEEETTSPSDGPMAKTEKWLPFATLKKIFVNQSF